VNGDLCGNFGNTLEIISDSILTLSSAFQLGREPVVATIRVTVNGVQVPNDATNGWTYESSNNTIVFHGSAIPDANANIQIAYDPVTVKD